MLPLVKTAPLGGEVRFGDGQLEGGAAVTRNRREGDHSAFTTLAGMTDQ